MLFLPGFVVEDAVSHPATAMRMPPIYGAQAAERRGLRFDPASLQVERTYSSDIRGRTQRLGRRGRDLPQALLGYVRKYPATGNGVIVVFMLLKIVQVGDPVLRAGTRVVNRDEIRSAEIQRLIEWMRETLRDAPGVGLAAPQVGLPLRLAVIEDAVEDPSLDRKPVPFHVIINPVLTLGPDTVDGVEGCLSLDGFRAKVRRARSVRVDAFDHSGGSVTIEATGWYARILQHEVDHLDGHLYIDRMDTRTFSTVHNSLRSQTAAG